MTVLVNSENILIERCEIACERFSLLESMRVERGTVDDWNQLHELHYKSEGRVVGRTWRCMLNDQLIGVAIISSPRLLLAGRHELFPKLKPGGDTRLTNVYRAKYINKNFSVVSRIVVDTLFRAVGVSYRMMNLIARMEGKQYMEIQSSMSRFNPFAIKAGFKFTSVRKAAAYDKGLIFMKKYFTTHPADFISVMAELDEMRPNMRSKTIQAMREFYYKHSALEKTGANLGNGMTKVNEYTDAILIKNIQQLIFATPMYGVYKNPDVGSEMPSALPLLAFDRQRVTEKMRLS